MWACYACLSSSYCLQLNAEEVKLFSEKLGKYFPFYLLEFVPNKIEKHPPKSSKVPDITKESWFTALIKGARGILCLYWPRFSFEPGNETDVSLPPPGCTTVLQLLLTYLQYSLCYHTTDSLSNIDCCLSYVVLKFRDMKHCHLLWKFRAPTNGLRPRAHCLSKIILEIASSNGAAQQNNSVFPGLSPLWFI